MENFHEVYDTPAEVKAFADYSETRLEFGGDNPAEGDDLVPVQFQCPRCHERRPDFFLLDDDEGVTCQSCGHVYTLPTPARHCHCGAPLDDDECECEACTAEWNEFISDRYALVHPGALM
jgi:hypothetical protein